jgi:hypothetical protein
MSTLSNAHDNEHSERYSFLVGKTEIIEFKIENLSSSWDKAIHNLDHISTSLTTVVTQTDIIHKTLDDIIKRVHSLEINLQKNDFKRETLEALTHNHEVRISSLELKDRERQEREHLEKGANQTWGKIPKILSFIGAAIVGTVGILLSYEHYQDGEFERTESLKKIEAEKEIETLKQIKELEKKRYDRERYLIRNGILTKEDLPDEVK